MIFRCVLVWCLRTEIALMRAHVVEWEDDLRRLPGVIGEYQRRIVEAEAALRDLQEEQRTRYKD